MDLDIILNQTTWNEASNSINNNFLKVKEAIEAGIGSGGGSGESITVEQSGTGNVVSDVTKTGSVITVTKDISALTASSVVNRGASLEWSKSAIIATIGGKNITVALPANPNVNTLNTAGVSNNTDNKLFLVGSLSQSGSAVTYTNEGCYIGADNYLYSNSTKVSLDGHTHTFASLTSKPTMLAGYGITDAYTKTEVNNALSGYLPLSGGTMSNTNVVTNLNADLLDGHHASSFTKYKTDNSLGVHSPFSTVTEWATSSNLNGTANIVYNYNGIEYSLLFSLRPDNYKHGTILRWGYDNTYLYIARKNNGIWSSNDWEKISAGLADSATKLKTPRTLWGQSFDGTANVSGAMSGITTLSASGSVSLGSTLTVSGNATIHGATTINNTLNANSYRGYFNQSNATNKGSYTHLFGRGSQGLGQDSVSLGNNSFAGIRNEDSDAATYPYIAWQWMDTEAITVNGSTAYGFLVAGNGTEQTYTLEGTTFTYTNDSSNARVVVIVKDTDTLIFGGKSYYPYTTTKTLINNFILGSGERILGVTERVVNDTTYYELKLYTWNASLSSSYDFSIQARILCATKVNKNNYDGVSTFASGISSVASGRYSVASGQDAVASGQSSVASGISSIASGSYSVASGSYSVASGGDSIASGSYSVASGRYSVASGQNAVASGQFSVASGYKSTASGYSSTAIGLGSSASHDFSCIIGNSCKSGNAYQTVVGLYNTPTTDVFIVGYGKSDTERKNVFTVSSGGNTYVGGTLSVVGAATFSSSVKATKFTVDGTNFITWDSTNNAWKIDGNLYATGGITALGSGIAGGGGTSYERLDAWSDYDSSKAGYVLSAALGYDLNERVANLESGTAQTNLTVTLDLYRIIDDTHGGSATFDNDSIESCGITSQVINNMLNGKYTKVLAISPEEQSCWDYYVQKRGNSTYIQFSYGDGSYVHTALSMGQETTGGSWVVNFGEI